MPILQHFLRFGAIWLRIRAESSAKINESRASCLDLGIFGANRAVLGIASLGGCNMASAFGPRLWRRTAVSVPPARSRGRRMTWHAAAALLDFAALQIRSEEGRVGKESVSTGRSRGGSDP